MTDQKHRLTHTNWTRYNCCDNRKHYQFRVTVELVGVDGSDPEQVSLYDIGELMLNAGDALQNYVDNERERDREPNDE